MQVFFYGTLMRGEVNHGVLVRMNARFVACARTAEPRTLVDLGPYPALLPVDAGDAHFVHGEVFEIDAAMLEELDAFEGCPDLYRRETIELEIDHQRTEGFVYVLARSVPATARVVTSGRYEGGGQHLGANAREADLD